MNEQNEEMRKKIIELLERIPSKSLLERIYRFAKHIYIYQ